MEKTSMRDPKDEAKWEIEKCKKREGKKIKTNKKNVPLFRR